MTTPHPLIQQVDPAPHRGATSLPVLFFGLLAGPIAWSVTQLVSYGLGSHACYGTGPRAEVLTGWEWLWTTVLLLHLAGIAIAIVAAGSSWRVWRNTRGEGGEGATDLLEAGEGRTRFVAVWGILSGLSSVVAIGFSGIAILGLPPCANLLPP